MKKLIIIASIIVGSLSTYAAATDWAVTCGNMKDHTGQAFTGSYILWATGGDLSSDLQILSVADSGATYNKYQFTVDSGLTPDQSYNFYYVLTDSQGYTFTSSVKGPYAALATGTQTIGFGNQATATTEGTWTAAPEPTSGILLLLGMAGLALKRKRA